MVLSGSIKFENGPFIGGYLVTPGTQGKPFRALWIGATSGTVTITMFDGSSLVIPVAANQLVPIPGNTVTAATATTITALF